MVSIFIIFEFLRAEKVGHKGVEPILGDSCGTDSLVRELPALLSFAAVLWHCFVVSVSSELVTQCYQRQEDFMGLTEYANDFSL